MKQLVIITAFSKLSSSDLPSSKANHCWKVMGEQYSSLICIACWMLDRRVKQQSQEIDPLEYHQIPSLK
jgi:hypothetical protein